MRRLCSVQRIGYDDSKDAWFRPGMPGLRGNNGTKGVQRGEAPLRYSSSPFAKGGLALGVEGEEGTARATSGVMRPQRPGFPLS